MPYKEIESGGKWKPTEIGDNLSGEYISKESIPGKNNKTFDVFVIETEAGERLSISGAVIEAKMNRMGPGNNPMVSVGDRVSITYKGDKKGQNGSYPDYSLGVWESEGMPQL